MRPPTVLVVVATIVLVFSGTCKAAADKDRCVNYNFCVSELSKDNSSSHADAWGLAKGAAKMGEFNAENTIDDIESLKAKPGTNAKTNAALDQCEGLYNTMKFAFNTAYGEINSRRYSSGKEEVARALSLAHQCDNVFLKAAVPSPLAQHSIYTMHIAIVCTAITNLIK